MGSSPSLPPADIAERVRARFGDDVLEAAAAHGDAVVRVTPERYVEVVRFLRDDPELAFDFLDFVGAVDWRAKGAPPLKQDSSVSELQDDADLGFEVVAQLYSTTRHHRARVGVTCGREDPRCPSLAEVYAGAVWHERETWELFGISFDGHPGLVKLLLPEEFEGYPLRKDFPLTTRAAKPWPGAEVLSGEEGEGGG